MRGQLEGMLEQRGVDGARRLLDSYLDEELAQVEGMIANWDQKQGKTPNLLAHFVKERVGGVRAVACVTPARAAPSERLLECIRRHMRCPDGMTRDELRGVVGVAAKRRGFSPDELIDLAAPGFVDWEGE